MTAGFIIGFFGSLHCFSMCGPLMMTLMGNRRSSKGVLLYHLGRLLSYSLIGVGLGVLGSLLYLLHLQQFFTIAIGVIMLLIYAVPGVKFKIEQMFARTGITSYLQRTLFTKLTNAQRWVLSGALNGLLPCGLTYIAAAFAVSQETILMTVSTMFAFGLGTIPALSIMYFSGDFLLNKLKKGSSFILKGVAIFSALLLIYRGVSQNYAGLNIRGERTATQSGVMCGR